MSQSVESKKASVPQETLAVSATTKIGVEKVHRSSSPYLKNRQNKVEKVCEG